MRFLKAILALIVFVLLTATFIFSEDSKVRVTASKANIRLKPDTQSEVVTSVPLGALLDIIKKEGDWYFVKLPPDAKGIVITGYLHQSTAEVIEEIKETAEPEKKTETQQVVPKPVEPKLELSTDASYLKWKEDYDKAEKNFKGWKKYAYIGQAGFGAGVLINLLTGVSAKENYLTGVIVGSSVALGGIGLWLYAANRRSSAKERMELLMNEGRIKKYIGASINPRAKYYAVSLAVAF